MLDEGDQQLYKIDEDGKKNTETAVMDALMVVPSFTVINISVVSPSTIACPAMILAKRRIISAKGLVNSPTISIIGISGIGTFSHTGTSGQNTSL